MMGTADIEVTINGQQYQVPAGATVLEAAMQYDIYIPTLCYHEKLRPYGACRICQVEHTPAGKDRTALVAACTHPLQEGDAVRTESDQVTEARRFVLQLLMARAPQAKALNKLAEQYNVDLKPDSEEPLEAYLGAKMNKRREEAGPEGLTRCIMCGLCTRVCRERVGREGVSEVGRGPDRRVRPPFNDISPTCIGCGACAYICPNDAITIERVSE